MEAVHVRGPGLHRVQDGLNKGEARNALAHAVFFYRHGRVQDRSHAQQRRAQGLNLVVAAIILWNTIVLFYIHSASPGTSSTRSAIETPRVLAILIRVFTVGL